MDLSGVLMEISKLKLKGNRAELELKIGLQKLRLITANPEEKVEIEQSIARCNDLIRDIYEYLKGL